MKKYIRFYITFGGDAGWRFTNVDELCSYKFTLLFDASLWTIESIKKELDKIDYDIFHDRNRGYSVGEKGACGAKHLKNFVMRNQGIYTFEHACPWGCQDFLPIIDKTTDCKIEDWNLNGKTRNSYIW